MNWIFYLLIAMLSYGLYNVLIKLSSATLHPVAGAIGLQIGAVVCPVIAYLCLRSGGAQHPFTLAVSGFKFAILAGVFVGLAELMTFLVFARGIAGTVAIPAIIGGSVAAGVFFSMILFRESLGPRDFAAVALIIAGIVLLAGRGS